MGYYKKKLWIDRRTLVCCANFSEHMVRQLRAFVTLFEENDEEKNGVFCRGWESLFGGDCRRVLVLQRGLMRDFVDLPSLAPPKRQTREHFTDEPFEASYFLSFSFHFSF